MLRLVNGMTNIKLEEGFLIKRVTNGWTVQMLSENDSNFILTYVYEDEGIGDFTICAASSLKNLIHECFESYMQSKRSPGLYLEVKKKGWCEEND